MINLEDMLALYGIYTEKPGPDDNRANQKNPNHNKTNNNRANQKNPNNPNYKK